MEETLSVRIPRKEFNEINRLMGYKNSSKANLLREILSIGIKNKKLEIAIEKFQKEEVTLTRASEISGIPLTQFLDILHKKAINLHYGIEELREDIADLIK